MGNNVPLRERGFLNGDGSGTVAAVFNNLAGALLQIDNTAAGQDGITNEVITTFTNAGTVSIGTSGSIGGNGFANAGTVSNSACATLTVAAPINNSNSFTNAGFFTVITTRPHSNTGTLTNNGVISYPLGNPIPNVINNDVIVAPLSLCGTASTTALQIGGANRFQVGTTWYSDFPLTQQAGTYDNGTNTFTPTNQTVCRSSGVVLTASTTGVRYEWYKNGTSAPFKLTGIASIQRGMATSSLTLVSVQTSASYYVKVFQANNSFTFEGPYGVTVNYGCVAPGARVATESVVEVPQRILLMPNPVTDSQLRAVVRGANYPHQSA
jgi:hypothetical protein